MYSNKKAIAFDLDGTLTPSKLPIEKDVAELICKLLKFGDKKIAVMSGGRFERFQTQFLNLLPCLKEGDCDHTLKNVYLFPGNGSTCYLYKEGKWKQIYNEPFSEKERAEVIAAIRKTEAEIVGPMRKTVYGDPIEDRGGQITFSIIGQNAPLSEKLRFDPDYDKRKRIAEYLKNLLPNYDIKMGGTTSVDIDKQGINKAYAIRKFEEYSGVPISDILFVGDAMFPGGNDYQALETGVDGVKVNGPKDTAKLIKEILGI